MKSLWLQVCRVLRQTLDSELFTQWIEPLKSTLIPSGDLILEAPSRFHHDWIKEHYLSDILQSCSRIDSTARVLLKLPVGRRNPFAIPRPCVGNVPLTAKFQDSQTFDNYVVAPFNRFALAAAQDACRDGVPKFNPLFIQSPPGLGKTHLLQAIGNAWLAANDRTAVYLNCRDFPFYETSVSLDSPDIFLHSLDGVRIILVDDVHLMPGVGGLQQRLRETFDICYDSDKQMVFAARYLPHQIRDLQTGLRSRLGWGLIARISEPDFKGWYQVMQTFLGETEMPASPGVCQYFAEQGPLNFLDIRKSVEKLQEIVEKEDYPPYLRGGVSTSHGDAAPDPQRLSIQAIQEKISAAYGVPPEALVGKKKSRPLVVARQVGMYLSRKLTGSTYAMIGEAFGGRDHSTVIYACRKVRAEMRRTQQFANHLVEIEKNLLKLYKKEYPVKFKA